MGESTCLPHFQHPPALQSKSAFFSNSEKPVLLKKKKKRVLKESQHWPYLFHHFLSMLTNATSITELGNEKEHEEKKIMKRTDYALEKARMQYVR